MGHKAALAHDTWVMLYTKYFDNDPGQSSPGSAREPERAFHRLRGSLHSSRNLQAQLTLPCLLIRLFLCSYKHVLQPNQPTGVLEFCSCFRTLTLAPAISPVEDALAPSVPGGTTSEASHWFLPSLFHLSPLSSWEPLISTSPLPSTAEKLSGCPSLCSSNSSHHCVPYTLMQ